MLEADPDELLRVRNSQNHLLSELMFIFNVRSEFNALLKKFLQDFARTKQISGFDTSQQ